MSSVVSLPQPIALWDENTKTWIKSGRGEEGEKRFARHPNTPHP